MAKKQRTGIPRVPVSFRLPRALWDRFKQYCADHVPRGVSDTEVVEKALTEYISRHEPKQKEGGKQ